MGSAAQRMDAMQHRVLCRVVCKVLAVLRDLQVAMKPGLASFRHASLGREQTRVCDAIKVPAISATLPSVKRITAGRASKGLLRIRGSSCFRSLTSHRPTQSTTNS